MSKIKIVNAYYNSDLGTSKVIIQTDLGKFFGFTKIHPEDEDIKSNFQGCRYAELRAIVKYKQRKLKNLKIKRDTLENLYKGIEKLRDFDAAAAEFRYVKKQYHIVQNEVDNLTKEINNINEYIYNTMKNYRKEKENFQKKINKYKEKRNARPESI